LATYINGIKVAENGRTLIERKPIQLINQFECAPIKETDLRFHLNELATEENGTMIPVIEALEGQLITNKIQVPTTSFTFINDCLQADIEHDYLYMVVINRYKPAAVAKAMVKNFGIQHGAIASSVAHDSHNIIAVGSNTKSLLEAIHYVTDAKGGVCSVLCNGQHETTEKILVPLPVGGLMSDADGYEVAEKYGAADRLAKKTGSTLAAPFMTLSFMALLVIPYLKLSDKGLTVCDENGIRIV
jgi:adenine deaminase